MTQVESHCSYSICRLLWDNLKTLKHCQCLILWTSKVPGYKKIMGHLVCRDEKLLSVLEIIGLSIWPYSSYIPLYIYFPLKIDRKISNNSDFLQTKVCFSRCKVMHTWKRLAIFSFSVFFRVLIVRSKEHWFDCVRMLKQ